MGLRSPAKSKATSPSGFNEAMTESKSRFDKSQAVALCALFTIVPLRISSKAERGARGAWIFPFLSYFGITRRLSPTRTESYPAAIAKSSMSFWFSVLPGRFNFAARSASSDALSVLVALTKRASLPGVSTKEKFAFSPLLARKTFTELAIVRSERSSTVNRAMPVRSDKIVAAESILVAGSSNCFAMPSTSTKSSTPLKTPLSSLVNASWASAIAELRSSVNLRISACNRVALSALKAPSSSKAFNSVVRASKDFTSSSFNKAAVPGETLSIAPSARVTCDPASTVPCRLNGFNAVAFTLAN